MKKLIPAFALLAVLYSCTKSNHENSTHQPENSNSTALQTAHVEPLKYEAFRAPIEASAIVDVPPQYRADVHAPCRAYVSECSVLVGDRVKKGQILAKLEHPEIIQLQSEWMQAHANWGFTLEAHRRNSELHASNAISARDFQVSQRDHAQSVARYQELTQRLKWLGLDPNFILDNGIQTEIAVTAPISGFVQMAHINLGKFVNPENALFTVVGKDHSHLEIGVYAEFLGSISVGDSISAKLETGRVLAGEVFLISEAIDPADNRFQVHGHFEDEADAPAPGTFLQVTLFAESDLTWILPTSAIWQEEGKWWALRQIDEGFEPVLIERGKESPETIEVMNGSEYENDLFVTENVYFLRHSQGEKSETGYSH